MSLQPITSFRNGFSTPALNDTTPSTPKPFVRTPKAGTSTNAIHASAKAVSLPLLGPVGKWRSQVFQACENLGLNPGEQTTVVVRKASDPKGPLIERPMILRRTRTDNAYVFQTPENSLDRPFQGLHLKGDLEMRYNLELIPLDSAQSKYAVAKQQFFDLSCALGVPVGGTGY